MEGKVALFSGPKPDLDAERRREEAWVHQVKLELSTHYHAHRDPWGCRICRIHEARSMRQPLYRLMEAPIVSDDYYGWLRTRIHLLG